MTLPIGPNDTVVDLGPGRDQRLPTIYLTDSRPKKSGPGNIYYYIQNLAASELAKAMELEAEPRIPHGPEGLAIQRGFLKLEENDIMFVRSSTAPASGEEDVAVCWVTGDSLYTRDEKKKLLAARDDCLDRKEDRTRQAPTLKPDGTFVGGTAFERNKRANPVKANT